MERARPTVSLRYECVQVGAAAIGPTQPVQRRGRRRRLLRREKEVTLSVAGQKIVSRVSGVGPTDSGPRVGDTVQVGWSLTAPVILQDCAS